MDYTTLEGEIRIRPELNWGEYQKLRAALAKKITSGNNHWDAKYVEEPGWEPRQYLGFGPVVEESERETDEGVLHIRKVSRLSFREESGSLGRSLTPADVVKTVHSLFPQHILEGELLLVGEDYQDIHKVVAAEGKVTVVKGQVVINWADGSAAYTLSC